MEARQILQAIGMEATVVAILCGIAYAAIRVTLAERKPRASDEQTYATVTTERRFN